MAGYLARHARYHLHAEDGLRLGAEGDRRLEGVGYAMASEELEEICRVLVDNDVGVGNVDTEAIGQELFSILYAGGISLEPTDYYTKNLRTLPNKVLSSSEIFFSLASASGTSITSANWLPSPSTKRALKDPASVDAGPDTSCCVLVRSRVSLFCFLDGGGRIVDILKSWGRAPALCR